MSIDTKLDMSLPPPSGDGEQYNNLVVKAKTNKPVGDGDDFPALDKTIKAVFGDDIDSLEEAQDLASRFNLNLQIGKSLTNAKATMQEELDNLDPSNPRVPILGKYIDVCDKLLEGKSIPGVNFAIGLNIDGSTFVEMDIDKVGVAAAPKTNITGTVGGNPWLAGNAYVNFMVTFMTLAKLMMLNMAVESKAEVASLGMMFELGNLAAKQIITSGEQAAEMHKIAGITAAISAATTGITTLASAKGMWKNRMRPEPTEAQSFQKINANGKPPNLNNEYHPRLDANGKPLMTAKPKYIQTEDGTVYRNEPPPKYKSWRPNENGKFSAPVDKYGHPYLDRGATPLEPSNPRTGFVNPSADAAGIKGVHRPGSAADVSQRNMDNGGGGERPPVDSKMSPSYEQQKVQSKPAANPDDPDEKFVVTEKSDIHHDNELRSQAYQKYSMFGQSARDFSSQTTKSVEEFMKIELEIKKAQAEALKEIFSTLSRLASHALDRASEGLKSNNELFAQLIQQLDSIRAKLQEAINAALKKSG